MRVKENPPGGGFEVLSHADVMPVIIVILQMNDFAVVDFFFITVQGMEGFSQCNTMAGDGDIVIFAFAHIVAEQRRHVV